MVGGRKRILIVDDEAMVRQVLVLTLSTRHDIAEAASATEALEALRAGPFDLMVVDLVLPDRNGLWLIDQARLIQPGLPCLISAGDVEGIENQLVARDLCYLVKPYRMADLLVTVSSLLQSHAPDA